MYKSKKLGKIKQKWLDLWSEQEVGGIGWEEGWNFIEKSITQSENRILRKWKKAINEARYCPTYLIRDVLDKEYLKAKGGSK